MSLLGVLEFSAFHPVITSSKTTPRPLTGIRLKPSATPLWGGPSGHLADPIPNTILWPKEFQICQTSNTLLRPNGHRLNGCCLCLAPQTKYDSSTVRRKMKVRSIFEQFKAIVAKWTLGT